MQPYLCFLKDKNRINEALIEFLPAQVIWCLDYFQKESVSQETQFYLVILDTKISFQSISCK